MAAPLSSELSRRASLAIVALVSAGTVAIEVLITRLLSVTTWYGLAFVVLSIAMLGLTSGSMAALDARRRALPLRPWIVERLLVMALALALATALLTYMPILAPNGLLLGLLSFLALLVSAVAVALPLTAGGGIVARLMTESPARFSTMYAADLGAAALGALLPLAILGPLSAPAALLAIAATIALASALLASDARNTRNTRARNGGLVVAIAGAALVVASAVSPSVLAVTCAKGESLSDGPKPIYEAWNALSHLYVAPFHKTRHLFWSPSPIAPPFKRELAVARIDGDAGTYIYAYRDVAELELLRFDATTSAHALRPRGTACVIGVGGGRDLLSALVFGHERVIGAEVNPAMVDMLRRLGDRSPIATDPRVDLRVGDGREVFTRESSQCTVLQASLVDTWAATSAGAFAHAESTVYTREAWSVFLRRVEPRGILTFSRWYEPERASEVARLIALAVASLLDRGVDKPRDHIAVVAAGAIATLLVSPAPFDAADRAALAELASTRGFTLLATPDVRPRHPLLDQLLDARTIDALAAAGEPYGLDTSAASDDRPFFFQLVSARLWLHPFEAVRMIGAQGVIGGNVTDMFELSTAFLVILLIGGALLAPGLVRAAREKDGPPLPVRAWVYFGALGAGFMIAEIALVERMHVVLGHPTYALVFVLFGLLLATGVGSALSPYVARTRASVGVLALLCSAILVALPSLWIRPIAHTLVGAPLALRATWAASTAGLVGVALGTLFPSALRYVDRERGTPVALAINGLASVLGSIAAILASVWLGIPGAMALSGACYFVAAIAGPQGWRDRARE